MNTNTPTHQTAQTELEELLQPLIDLFNQKYRGGWEEDFRFCHEAGFKPLMDSDCALIELPDDPDKYPGMVHGLRELLLLTEDCLHPYRGRPDGEGPVCGPCRFSAQRKAFPDGMHAYVHGAHLVVEREDLNVGAAKRQIAYLTRELRNQPTSLSNYPLF